MTVVSRMKRFKKFSSFSQSKYKQQRIVSWAIKQKQKSICFKKINFDIDSIPIKAISQNVQLICPLIGCSGLGHVNGQSPTHITLSGCPNYHNFSFEKWTEMCIREEGIVPQIASQNTLNSPGKNHKSFVDSSQQFRTSYKEPLLDDLASQVEIYQFRRAQQRLVSSNENEAKEHLQLCARVASLFDGDLGSDNGSNYATEQRIHFVVFGMWELEPLYQSNYLPSVRCLPTIYVCEFCLTPMCHNVAYERHRINCGRTYPPGDEIYRKDNLSFFEIDGQTHREYCRNLCLLAKLFLKQKTVHELDRVSAFLFYILTETDHNGSHIIGYFSKQKPEDQYDPNLNVMYNNLSCLVIMPHYQCRGFGRMLIEMSYVLSRLEQRVGTPERPLSDLGLIIYRKYWRSQILIYLSHFQTKSINIRTMSQDLGIAIPDIVSTLLDMKMLIYYRTQYYIINNKAEVDFLLSKMKTQDINKRIDTTCLHWVPQLNVITNNTNNLKPNKLTLPGSVESSVMS